MDIERISAFGTWRYAREFLDGATLVREPPVGPLEEMKFQHSVVAYYLVGHSIELSLKSFLLCRGVSPKKLSSREFGHKLNALRAEASRRKLGIEVALTKQEKATIDYFSGTYASKSHEYFATGSMRLPRYSDLHAVATKLVEALHDISSLFGGSYRRHLRPFWRPFSVRRCDYSTQL